MKSFKTKTTEATYDAGYIVITESGYPEGVCIPDKRSARALGKWLLKVTEPTKKAPRQEPRVGTKVTITTKMYNKAWLNLPGVITGIDYSGTWPYDVAITLPGGRVEPALLDRNEFEVRK